MVSKGSWALYDKYKFFLNIKTSERQISPHHGSALAEELRKNAIITLESKDENRKRRVEAQNQEVVALSLEQSQLKD
jgi:hypothetical protein